MQIYNQKKTSAKIGKKSDLGGSWVPFGKGLGRSGASWDHFWAHFDCSLDVPNHIFLKQWSKMGSKRPFGWLLDRFWEGLGRIWMRLGRIWAFKIKAFASHGHFLNTLGVPCCLTLCYRNPRAASLRLAERHMQFLRKFFEKSIRKAHSIIREIPLRPDCADRTGRAPQLASSTSWQASSRNSVKNN